MANDSASATQLEQCLLRMRAGDPAARDELLGHVCDRLRRLTRTMLKDYPGVRRWEQTDDVLQNALLRLLRALGDVQPASLRDFFALSALQIRRELLDLARHHYGPLGPGAHHASAGPTTDSRGPGWEAADQTNEPGKLAQWCEFHEQVEGLPEDEREVVGLLFYQGLTQAEAAGLLRVTVRTVQRRWQAALLKLRRILD